MNRRAQPWLGTLVDITIADALDEIALRHAFDAAFAQVALVHRLMSFHDPDSDIGRINAAPAGKLVEVDLHTGEVLALAAEVKAASGGSFDIACAPQLVEWGLLPAAAPGAPRFEPGKEIVRIEADKRARKLAEGWIDVGGIAKGYAVDLAIRALREAGIVSACVNAGGDLRVIGPQPLPVAIRDPREPTHIACEIELTDEALATSAPYFSAGESASALCDARTGTSIMDAVSVSVRAPLCVVADALTKVVIATRDPGHPVLRHFGASSFIL
ncbi:FAD:protein FMN transferase [Oxalobacteraceae bacterium OM1]|nr:FAD:protein FMN transferase [Oxalobacteraceae bacterium OM1]